MDVSAAAEHEVSKNIGQESVWKYSGILPLIVLALTGLDKALQWLTYVAMIHCFYCSQDCTQESEQPHVRWMLPLVVLAWEIFWETTLANQTKVIVVWN